MSVKICLFSHNLVITCSRIFIFQNLFFGIISLKSQLLGPIRQSVFFRAMSERPDKLRLITLYDIDDWRETLLQAKSRIQNVTRIPDEMTCLILWTCVITARYT